MGGLDLVGGKPASSRVRVTVALAVGVLAGSVVLWLGERVLALLVGWDVTVVVYVAWTWASTWRLDADATAELAVREDPGRAVTDALMLIASVASLAAVGAVIATAGSRAGVDRQVGIGIGVASVVLSWTLVHTVFTARYAQLYYAGPDGGVDFHEEDPPRYRDFAYMSFTVGMTYQVSDTNITEKAMRETVLRHALLSYLLGAVILAATINLVAGLTR
jgi:uncharacterized membrane protein